RRAGENIAAAEVEACLLSHPLVRQVAVMAAPDEIREAEVLACVELKDSNVADCSQDTADLSSAQQQDIAQSLFDHCFAELAYYKAPGWIILLNEIPTTGTQKIQKHKIFQPGSDPRQTSGMMDFRHLKKRSRP